MAWVEQHGGGFRVRYRLPDGSIGSETGFPTKTAARDRAADIDTDQRRGSFIDPRAGQMPLEQWVRVWAAAHEVSAGTWAKYQSHLRQHILPTFADTALAQISRIAVKAWVKTLRRRLATATVADVVSLLSTILTDAVEEGMIGANPCRNLRITPGNRPERPHASPAQVLHLAERCAPAHRALILTAAYTGLRWGELAGLQWTHLNLTRATLTVDPDQGALHELGGRLILGAPKTPASARTVHLPPFLTDLLTTHHSHAEGRFVFTGTDGGLLRRSNFRRRVWLPAVAGDPTRGWAPIHPGLHFHDVRHTHKTWLIEDGVPEIAQAKRLGHRLPGIRGIYSHVTQPMIEALLVGLQRRWEHLLPDHIPAPYVVKINCSQIAPTNTERPTGKDHQQAV